MLFDPPIAPGVSFTDKRSTDEEARKVYWDTLHLRDKITPENTLKRNLKLNPLKGEEILIAFCSPENRKEFPNLFAQQKSSFPHDYEEDGELEKAIALSLQDEQAPEVAPTGDSHEDDCSIM